MDFFITSIFLVFAILFLIVGVQFYRGKWLRLLSGNNYGELPVKEAIIIARKSSYLMFFAAIYIIFLWWWLYFSENIVLFWCVTGVALLVSVVIPVKSLHHWIKTGY